MVAPYLYSITAYCAAYGKPTTYPPGAYRLPGASCAYALGQPWGLGLGAFRVHARREPRAALRACNLSCVKLYLHT